MRTRQKAIAAGYRSGLEERTAVDLKERGVQAEYESVTLDYCIPERMAKYTPDFVLPSGIVVETKGRFVAVDRYKHQLVKLWNPHIDIRFVFSNSKARLSKNSNTTYAMWCEKNGFEYAEKRVPDDWLTE